MAFRSFSVLFEDPIKLFLSCLRPDKTSQYHYWVQHAKVFRENSSFQISPTTRLSPENFDNQVFYSESNPFRRLLVRLIRSSVNITSKLSLVATCHIRNAQNNIFKARHLTRQHWSLPWRFSQ